MIITAPTCRRPRTATGPAIALAIILLATAAVLRHLLQANQARRHAFDSIIVEAANRHGVAPALVWAVIRQESDFDPRRVGGKNEIGLMQITPNATRDWATAHARDYRFRGQLADPRFNIEVGTWYLAKGLKRWHDYRDAEVLALAEYNAGRVRALRWAPENPQENALERVGISSTKAYITKILDYRGHFRPKRDSK